MSRQVLGIYLLYARSFPSHTMPAGLCASPALQPLLCCASAPARLLQGCAARETALGTGPPTTLKQQGQPAMLHQHGLSHASCTVKVTFSRSARCAVQVAGAISVLARTSAALSTGYNGSPRVGGSLTPRHTAARHVAERQGSGDLSHGAV